MNKIITADPKQCKVMKNCRKIFNKNNNEWIWDELMQLKKQSNIIQNTKQQQRNIQVTETCQLT